MFWNKNNKDELYVHCDIDNLRAAYRIEPGAHTELALLIDGTRVQILNLSANGIAFELDESCDPRLDNAKQMQGILYIDHQHSPISLQLSVVNRHERILRCQIDHQDELAQRQLAAAIIEHQKRQIRANSQHTSPDQRPKSPRQSSDTPQ